MSGKNILKIIFDNAMYEEIMNFCRNLNESIADVYITMSRKAACFINFLEKHGFISLNGVVYTDRILDFSEMDFTGRSVIVIDDVVVSGTTLYNVVSKLKKFKVKTITIKVLGVNKEFFNKQLFDYTEAGENKNYIEGPYQLMSDELCTYTCSNIASVFGLDSTSYDVDFPKHDAVFIHEDDFTKLVLSNLWRSYDVSNTLQSDYKIKNITLLPTSSLVERINNTLGDTFSQIGHFKIRIFASYSVKRKKGYIVNAVPYFLFNAISDNQINELFSLVFHANDVSNITTITKIRLLQYLFAERVFLIWSDLVNHSVGKKINFVLRKIDFLRIFPSNYYHPFIKAIQKEILLSNYSYQPLNLKNPILESCINKTRLIENKSLLQTKLIEPFSDLYYNKELNARRIVKQYGKKAFELKEYQDIFFRLNHGLSFNDLLEIINNYSDIYDKRTTVSLFIDEAVDSGVIVPIIAEEYDTKSQIKYYYRAFRHGEDVPFGEYQEKLCAILLSNYQSFGGTEALSKLRVEKLLVLFLKIGSLQQFFKLNTYDSIYYKVNIDAYLFGNVLTTQDISSHRSTHYLTHKTDKVWVTQVLKEKNIINYDSNDKITGITDHIDISVDKKTVGQVSAIGKTFGVLYKNTKERIEPKITDDDLIMFSTCLFPQDIMNALASELSIFRDRYSSKRKQIQEALLQEKTESIRELLLSNDLYTSINTGQKKYFYFIEKEGLRRIEEISNQLNTSTELSIYGSLWDQFWPSNMDWNTDSINSDVMKTINSEGKIILVLNILCRMLLLKTSTDKEYSEKMIDQIKNYHRKIRTRPFVKDNDIKRLIAFSNESISIPIKFCFETDIIQKIVNSIDYYIKFIPSLLSDVELLVNRHGKINEIIRYMHAVCIKLKDEHNTENNLREIKQLFSSNNIMTQEFPVRNPSTKFPEAGFWMFIRGNVNQSMINHLILQLISSKEQREKYQYIKVFYNLSDDLRLKIAAESSERKNFGIFPSYCDACKRVQDDINIDKFFVCWFIQHSGVNRYNINRMTDILKTGYNTIYKGSIPFETQSSSKTDYFILSFDSIKRGTYYLDCYRKELEKVEKKCEVFISYTEDSKEHVKRVRQIARCLQGIDMVVHFYDDTLFGTDIVEFMRQIETCDIILIIGTEKYKERACDENKSGASFEDRMIADVFMSDYREKIVPVAFGDFNTVIPAPFNKLKGMSMTQPTDEELNILARGITKKYLTSQKG